MTVWAEVYAPSNTGSPIASTDVTDANGYVRGLLDASVATPMNRDAECTIRVHKTHPSLSAFQPMRVVRVGDSDRGEITKFVVTEIDENDLDADPSGETVTIKGRTLISQLRNAVLRRHTSYNSGSTISYNFATPAYDDSAWAGSVVVVDRSAFGWTFPIGWPDPYTAGVWASTQTTGAVFGRLTKTLAAGRYVLYASGDPGFDVWLGGERWVEAWPKAGDKIPKWGRPTRCFILDLPAGTHVIGIEGRRTAGTGTLWASLWDTDGIYLGSPYWVTGPTSDPNPNFAGVKWLTYPASRPAPPITMGMIDFITRTQGDAAMAGWTTGFSGATDSDSVAVPTQEYSIDANKTGFDLAELIHGSGWGTFDVRKGAGKILDFHTSFGADNNITLDDDDSGSLRVRTVA